MIESLEQARKEIERLRALVDVTAESALLHSMRAAEAGERLQKETELLRGSTSWRLTFPLRAASLLVRQGPRLARRLARAIDRNGLPEVARRLRERVRTRRGGRQVGLKPGALDVYGCPVSHDPATLLTPRVLVIADLTLQQCAKYRVWQKQELFGRLGTICTVADWKDEARCRSLIQTHSLVIFYRLPGTRKMLGYADEVKRLRLPHYWEADDLIFDMARYLENRNLDTLQPELRESVLSGVGLFRRAMLACKRTIASTDALAQAMRDAGAGPPVVVENALDEETLATAGALRARPRPARAETVIVYGSGSKAHDADFAEAAPALAAILDARPQVRLRVIGDLTLPEALGAHVDRIERLPGTTYKDYLGLLAEGDIALAPLENTAFNDAKSNIKFIEAAVLGLPSVCSPRANFRSVIRDGENGMLAADEPAWRERLLQLVDDAGLRRSLGEAARRTVLDRYRPDVVAQTQVAPLVAGLDRRRRPALRVLVVNIYFAPFSFGGATVVAEEMVGHLSRREDVEIAVFTSAQPQQADEPLPYALLRYEWEGTPVFGIALPGHGAVTEFDDPQAAARFSDVLRGFAPDVVHFHSVQNLGAGLLRACADAAIPYVVTLHDAWWLCARQFMVTEENSYCFQTRIDLNVCEGCVPGALHLRQRFRILQQALSGARFLLSPSRAHRELHLANGFDPARVLVNTNGIRLPERPRKRRPGGKLRFGFVGGASGLKGYHLIQMAFARIESNAYELVLVDNALKLGLRSIAPADWKIKGTLTILPSYDQDGLDDFFDGIDVLLFPSQWKESFGLIVAEALARDVWVIVSEGGGAAEFVVDGENGTIIPLRNDPLPLQRAVEHLVERPELLAGYANPHKARLRSYAQQAEELWQILEQAAGLQPAARNSSRVLVSAPAGSG